MLVLHYNCAFDYVKATNLTVSDSLILFFETISLNGKRVGYVHRDYIFKKLEFSV